jgi:UDP-GlcNAc3NAcA epimerase
MLSTEKPEESRMKRILNIVGARPQFIKYYPVSRAIGIENAGSGDGIKDILVHTGQHYDYSMSKVFFDEFGIREPDYHLEVGSGCHGLQTGQVMQRTEEVLQKETPDAVIVYGDTNSTLGGALAASKLHIPVVHVEAGLRSFNKNMPEEINRIMTDHVSTLLLCPSGTAISNLREEGFKNIVNNGDLIAEHYASFNADINHPSVINVGDVMFDVVLHASEIADKKSGVLERLGLTKKDYCLLTIHRAENTDRKEIFEEVVGFVNRVSEGRKVIFPMHPRTKGAYEKIVKKFSPNVTIVEPVGYFDILTLLKNTSLAMTDSGGMQKEAFWLGVPCITLREETEWVETVESGWNVLYKDYKGAHKPVNSAPHYGDGKTAERIVGLIKAIKK